MTVDHVVLQSLIRNEAFGRKTIPFLKAEYFHDREDRILFEVIDAFCKKYNSFPSFEALRIDIQDRTDLNERSFRGVMDKVSELEKSDSSYELTHLLDVTEKFCQERAVHNAVMAAISILDDKTEKKASRGSIPVILTEALSVSFDTHVGHDYIEDAAARFEFYHRKQFLIPFDIDYLNRITSGGLAKKTLTVAIAGVGVGKSLFMCHCAATNLAAGLNVLYITNEMSEERIAERIDANLLDVATDQLRIIPRSAYEKKIERLKQTTVGRLIVKEYPPASASAANFRHLINELKLKKRFVPDIIYVDYLNICASSRLKMGSNVNSYTYMKSISEELRGLAIEFDLPLVTATQVNRTGFNDSDFGLENTSESFGITATADLMFAMIATEELEQMNQIMFKQLKNRYNDVSSIKRFCVGVDKSKMRLFNLEEAAQKSLIGEKFLTGDMLGSKQSKFDRTVFDSFK